MATKMLLALALVGAASAQTYKDLLGTNPKWTTSGKKMWKRSTNGRTPSGGTGPSKATDGAFAFLETSSPSRASWTSYMTSPTFKNQQTMTFKYHMYGAAMGTLSVEALQGKTWMTIWARDGQQQGKMTDAWKNAIACLPKGSTQVRIKGYAGRDYRSDMAVDTVVLNTKACSAGVIGDFERGMDGWTENLAKNWVRGTRTPSGGTGPAKAAKGRYFMFLETSGGATGTKSELLSPFLKGAAGSISFSYHMYGARMGSLELWQTRDGFKWTRLWRMSGQKHKAQGAAWTTASLRLTGTVAQLKFVGIKGNGYQSDMAVDDIKIGGYVKGAAPKPKPGAMYCGFEKRSSCGWKSTIKTGSHRLNKWNIGTRTPSGGTGSNKPYQGQYFAYLETSYGKKGSTAYLTSPNLPGGIKSMSFWYHMYGRTMGTLAVEACTGSATACGRSNAKFMPTAIQFVGQQHPKQTDKWYMAAVNLPPATKRVRFVGIKGSSYTGDIGLDEVLLSTKTATTPGCFFDSDAKICGWTGSGRKYWRRGYRTPSGGTGAGKAQSPRYFMFLETSVGGTPISYLNTPKLYPGTVSMTFYYHMYGRTMGTLDVQAKVGTKWTTVMTKKGQVQTKQNDPWHPTGVNLPKGTTQVRFKGTRGTSFTGDIGIDTVMFSSVKYVAPVTGPCPQGKYKSGPLCALCPRGTYGAKAGLKSLKECTPCKSGFYQNVNGQKSCKKCPTAKPDTLPGGNNMRDSIGDCLKMDPSCGFESNTMCGYQTKSLQGGNLLPCYRFRRGTRTPSFNTGAPKAKSGRYFMYVEASCGVPAVHGAVLESPPLKPGTKSVSFWYHMKGVNMGKMVVQTTTDGKTWTDTSFKKCKEVQKKQSDPWLYAGVDLPAGTQKFRFLGTRGGSWQGDMSVDQVQVSSAPFKAPTCTCSNGQLASMGCGGGQNCAKCNAGYFLQGTQCIKERGCKCPNGKATMGAKCYKAGAVVCDSCNTGYGLSAPAGSRTAKCIKTPTGGNCDFEVGTAPALCGWDQRLPAIPRRGRHAFWARGTRTPSGGTGAQKAQKGRYFLYLESSYGIKDDYDSLTSPPIAKGTKSFSFYYHMYGSHMGTLSVELFGKASIAAAQYVRIESASNVYTQGLNPVQSHSWDLFEVKCTDMSGKALKLEAYDWSHHRGNPQQDLAKMFDGNYNNYWAGSPGYCGGSQGGGGLPNGCQWVTIKLPKAYSKIKCSLWQSPTQWDWAVDYVKISGSADGKYFTKKTKSVKMGLGKTDMGVWDLTGKVWAPSGFSLSGAKSISNRDKWMQAAVNIPAGITQVRVTGMRGTGYAGDMSIDNFVMSSKSLTDDYKCGACRQSLPFTTKCSKCPVNQQGTRCMPESDAQTISISGCMWKKNTHSKAINVPAAYRVYPKGKKAWPALACEFECACLCRSTPGCISFDYKNAMTAPTIGSTSFERGLDGWTESGRMYWTRGTRTGSGGTGPNKAANGRYFMFLETSTGAATSYLNSPKAKSLSKMSFQYHMYGRTMGTLRLDAMVGGRWRNGIWTVKGQKHTSGNAAWTARTQTLPKGTTQVRFTGIRGTSYQSDMAVDNIKMTGVAGGTGGGKLCRMFSRQAIGGVTSNPIRGLRVQNVPCKDNHHHWDMLDTSCKPPAPPCGKGKYLNSFGVSCMSCPAGTYSSATNAKDASTCMKCPLNTFSSRTGASSCTKCPAGLITVTPGATKCIKATASCTFDANINICGWAGLRRTNGFGWRRGTRTPSASTGANRAHSGRFFVFLETSWAGTSATLTAAPITQKNAKSVTFYYHMTGAHIGKLTVEAKVGSKWVPTWSLSGRQHPSQRSPWLKTGVNLPKGATQIRFVGTRGTSWQGDISIDTVKVETTTWKFPTCKCPNGNAVTGAACSKAGQTICGSCKKGYYLAGTTCRKMSSCTCKNGMPVAYTRCPRDGFNRCQSCFDGFVINGNTCAPASTSCGFENSKMCGWTEDGRMYWRTGTRTPSGNTGAQKAHQGKSFAFLEASTAANLVSYLQSPVYPKGIKSMTFYYHMYGAAMGTLEVEAYAQSQFGKHAPPPPMPSGTCAVKLAVDAAMLPDAKTGKLPTIVGGPVTLQGHAHISKCGLQVDGLGDRAQLPHVDYAKDGTYTIAYWVTKDSCNRYANQGYWEYIYSHNKNTNDIDTAGNPGFNQYVGCHSSFLRTAIVGDKAEAITFDYDLHGAPVFNPTTDKWVHLVTAVSNSKLTLYADGVEVTDQNKLGRLATWGSMANIVAGKGPACPQSHGAGCVTLSKFSTLYGGSTMATNIHIGSRIDKQGYRHYDGTIAGVKVATTAVCANAAAQWFRAGMTALDNLGCDQRWVSTGWSLSGQQHKKASAPWTKAQVSLPAGSTAVRFKGIRGKSYTGDMAIDTVSVSAKAITGPKCKCANGVAAANTLCTSNGASVCVGCSEGYVLKAAKCVLATATCNFDTDDCGYATARGFSFGSYPLQWLIASPTLCKGDKGDTGIKTAGAEAAQSGDRFMFLETSRGTKEDEVYLVSPTVKKPIQSVTFYYHMHGGTMGTLSLDAYSGGKWVNGLWKKAGQTHADPKGPWFAAGVNLPKGTTAIRFGGTRGAGGDGDMAVDTVSTNSYSCTFTQKSATSISCKKKTTCSGDADGNSKVNVEDLLILLGSFGSTGAGLKADFDGNLKITVEDLLLLLANFGASC